MEDASTMIVPGDQIMESRLCDCSCARPCPFRKSGAEFRCSLESLAAYFQCDPDSALDRLHEWWPTGERENHERFQAFNEKTAKVLRDADEGKNLVRYPSLQEMFEAWDSTID